MGGGSFFLDKFIYYASYIDYMGRDILILSLAYLYNILLIVLK